jgi:D-3-phosphoglycerate dehydrogenase
MLVAVTSPSFSKNLRLQNEVSKYFPNLKLNLNGLRFNKSELIEYLRGADAAIIGLELIDEEVLKECPSLKIISKYGVGLNNIDLDACKKRGIKIGWTGGVNKLSVAEMTLGYMLMLCRNIFVTSNQLKEGIWNKSGGVQLSEKIIGIIGVGHIGKELIRLLKPFNCKILVNDIIKQDEYYTKNNLIETSKENIYRQADIITLHTPYDNTTHNLINKESFLMMKSSAFVINSARGGIINENDLKEVLIQNRIAGAAIDAYVVEPPTDQTLLKCENLICTPHIGGNAEEAVEEMGLSAINHIREFYKV